MKRVVIATTLFVAVVVGVGAQGTPAGEEEAIGRVLARFYGGWNEHHADKMVSAYAEDIDHIDVFGEWQKGRKTLRDERDGRTERAVADGQLHRRRAA